MAQIGRPLREIYVEPIQNPVPQREPVQVPEQAPAAPAPAREPEKVPA